MRSLDIHAHVVRQSYLQAVAKGNEWHGLKGRRGERHPKFVWTPAQRIADMDSLGVDVQVVSTSSSLYCYELDPLPPPRACA